MNNFPYSTKTRTHLVNFFRTRFRKKWIEGILILLNKNFSFAKKLVPPEYLYPTRSYRTATRDGVAYRLDLSDVIGHSLYFFNRYFAPNQFLKLLKPHWIVIDVGAHIGTAALPAAAIVNAGKVYAYEPFQENFDELEYNTQLNQFRNVVAIRKAVGKTTHKAQLFKVNQFNTGMNRIATKNTTVDEFEWVDVTTLDEEYERLKPDHIDIIKIDAEGFELNVLLGAERILQKFHPILIIELIDENLKGQGQSALEVIQFVKKFGYQCVDAKTSLPLVTWSKVETDILCYV